ncbi:MAG: hypothetical protein RIE59_19735 [Imperialibacter sp.]
MKWSVYFFVMPVFFLLVGCGSDEPEPERFSLDGHWETQYGNILEINGSSSAWVDLTRGDKYFSAALDQGFIEEDDPVIIEIEPTGRLTWTASRFVFAYDEAQNGDVTVLHGEYVAVDLALSEDAQVLTITGATPSSFPEGFSGSAFSFTLTRLE